MSNGEEERGPPTAPTAEPTATPDVTPEVAPETTPAEDEGAFREGLLSTVQEAVRPEPAEAPPAQQPEQSDPDDLSLEPAPAEQQDAQKEAEAETDDEVELPDEVSEVELDSYKSKPKVWKRVSNLLHQRAELRQAVKSAEPYLNTLRSGVTQDDANLALGAVQLLAKGEFQKFLEVLNPYIAAAQQATGAVLPADLEQQVREGYTTHAVASELAQRRSREAVLAEQVKQQTQQRQLDQQANQRNSIASAVTEWETGIRKTDPDYGKKSDLVQAAATQLMVERGMPNSPAQAVEWAKEAYEKVSASMRPAETLKPSMPSPSGAGQPSGSQPAPASLMEAAMQGLRNAQKGM